jgi:protease IV
VMAPSLIQSLGLDVLPAPVMEELATLKTLSSMAARGQWDKAAAAHCLCGLP